MHYRQLSPNAMPGFAVPAAATTVFLLSMFTGATLARSQPVICETPARVGDILVTQFGGMLYRVDPNGIDDPTSVISATYDAIAFDTAGRLIGNRGWDIVQIDLQHCEETILSDRGPLANATDMIIVGDLLYGTDDTAGIRGVVEVDLSNGNQRLVTSSANLPTIPGQDPPISNLLKPNGITSDGDGKLYVVDQGSVLGGSDGRIVKVDPAIPYNPSDPQANQTVIASGFGASLPDPGKIYDHFEMQDPLGITVDPDTGDLLVTDQSRVMRFRPNDGELTQTIALGVGLTLTNDIELDADGNYIVAGHDVYGMLSSVLRVTPGGAVTDLTPAPGSIARPRCVAVVPASAAAHCGDVDGSEIVSATDALAILQAAVAIRICDLCVCDVDGSTAVTATDALVALNKSVGLGGDLRCPPCA